MCHLSKSIPSATSGRQTKLQFSGVSSFLPSTNPLSLSPPLRVVCVFVSCLCLVPIFTSSNQKHFSLLSFCRESRVVLKSLTETFSSSSLKSKSVYSFMLRKTPTHPTTTPLLLPFSFYPPNLCLDLTIKPPFRAHR